MITIPPSFYKCKSWNTQTCPHCKKMYSFRDRDALEHEMHDIEPYGNVMVYICSNCHKVFFHHIDATKAEKKIDWNEIEKIEKKNKLEFQSMGLPPLQGD